MNKMNPERDMKHKNNLPSIKEAVAAINLPIDDWKGRCHQVAMALVGHSKLIAGRAAYGHWLGPVSRKSFFSKRQDMPFIQHGWIVQKKNIIDPTRWVFEAKKPYIFCGDDAEGFYDEGGNQWRENNIGGPPDFDANEKLFDVCLSDEAHEYVSEILCDDIREKLSMGQMFHIANRSPQILGVYTQQVYEWLRGIGCKAFVPVDNWMLIIGQEQ